jgi:hypothetical protein
MNINLLFEAVNLLAPNSKFNLNDKCEVVWDENNEVQKPSDNDIQNKVKELEAQAVLDEKSQAIENHIYANYPQKKQAQDEKWVSSYTTKLKAGGVENLEVKVVQMITSFFSGSTLEECLSGVNKEQKPLFEKLVKVGIRTEWAELCIIEGKRAIAKNDEPNYPEFPKLP